MNFRYHSADSKSQGIVVELTFTDPNANVVRYTSIVASSIENHNDYKMIKVHR